jgi:hypothetical protein
MDTRERRDLIRRYAEGPAVLKAALAEVPAEAMTWRPGPGKWSAHEVVLHCADSETNSYARIRYVLAEEDPLIVGYDQDRWASRLDYHALPLEPALATVAAVRGATVPLLERLPDAAWARTGRHTEHTEYGAEKWLRIYAEHLEVHAKQIRRNVEAWKAARKSGPVSR